MINLTRNAAGKAGNSQTGKIHKPSLLPFMHPSVNQSIHLLFHSFQVIMRFDWQKQLPDRGLHRTNSFPDCIAVI